MERQKLDFCRPVLPMRRFGQISSSEPVKNSVQAAGISRAIQFHPGKKSAWPKHEKRSVNQNPELPPIRPDIAETMASQEENDKEEWDTLSRNDTFLENFNISGSITLDESDRADPQAKDFMMRRFLRAAKAIASVIPPHSSRKMHVNHKQPKCATMAGKAAAKPISAYESTTYLEADAEECNEDNMNDEDQRHILGQRFDRLLQPMSRILSPFQEQGILFKRRGKSVHRESVKSAKTPNTVFEDMKRCTENYDRFHQKTKIVPSGKSLFQEVKYLSMTIPELPLPPSDSWLHRTLPSISSGNDGMVSYGSSKPKQQCKNPADPEQNRVGSKWETMVKASNPHRGHLPYSSSVV